MTCRMRDETYLVVDVAQIIDRSTEEGELAWDELTDHHCHPYVKDGMFVMNRFWLGYSKEPYENLKVSKEDYGDEWTNEGMLGKVVADYVLKNDPSFEAWDTVLLNVTW